jgi:Bacterial PH domain
MSDRDFNFEAQPGIPAPLPDGESVLWQGKPQTAALAREAYKINWILGYMIALALWRAGAAWADQGLPLMLATLLPYLALAAVGYVVIYALAWVQARATVYTITSARVILRIGAALPVTYTIPFTRITTAALAERPDGTGTIAMEIKGNHRIALAVLWPHARPWHLRQPQPAFRSIPDARQVARLLADAAQAKVNEPVIALRPTQATGLTLAAE